MKIRLNKAEAALVGLSADRDYEIRMRPETKEAKDKAGNVIARSNPGITAGTSAPFGGDVGPCKGIIILKPHGTGASQANESGWLK